ncbi:MAG: hypothetical protein L0Z62_04670 [Gemmataceae bacterium]|nr:hypothetical protein [Gemmataceae bacterium]
MRWLGGGGFGHVWEAVAPGGVKAALKFVRLDKETAAAELRALDAVRDVRHPNLLPLHRAWQQGGYLILAAGLADRSLAQRLKEAKDAGQKGIPVAELLPYMGQAAAAID